MFCIREYHFHNAQQYQKRKHYCQHIIFTTLTLEAAERFFESEKERRQGERRFREGCNWFSYRTMWITELKLETH